MRGGEGALLLGTVYPELIHGVVSYVGGSVAGVSYPSGDTAAWTLEGKPVPFTDPDNVIPVERISGPIFLVAGVDDLLWPSAIYAAEVVARLREHQRGDYTSLVYQRAGHLVASPFRTSRRPPRRSAAPPRPTPMRAQTRGRSCSPSSSGSRSS